jgi:hypothetical protein
MQKKGNREQACNRTRSAAVDSVSDITHATRAQVCEACWMFSRCKKKEIVNRHATEPEVPPLTVYQTSHMQHVRKFAKLAGCFRDAKKGNREQACNRTRSAAVDSATDITHPFQCSLSRGWPLILPPNAASRPLIDLSASHTSMNPSTLVSWAICERQSIKPTHTGTHARVATQEL